MRLIDADSIRYWKEHQCYGHGDFGEDELVSKQEIDRFPTITPESLVVHGLWRPLPSNGIGGTARCSICEKSIYGYRAFHYCPSCGAKMDLEE